jgi:segregation and condensation protein B
VNTDDATELDEDLESAYRKALLAVEATDLRQATNWVERNDEEPDVLPFPTADAESDELVRTPQRQPSQVVSEEADRRVNPRQVLESALFVGGIELSAERLAGLLKGEFTADFVMRSLAELNQRYVSENRPYEIRREENLFRLALRDEFEPLRRRVFGLGPKEVKLGQDALEILSLIAYRQPLSRTDIEALREGSAGPVLRQLVRRQLVAAVRSNEGGEMQYVTTNRFLEVFGLASLDELPRAESLSFK